MPSSNGLNQNFERKGHYRLVVMGAARVGKTSIIHQFLYDLFCNEYVPTIEELHRGEYELGNSTRLVLDILDTSGAYEFPAMRKLALETGDAFVLVYSINDAESFEEVRRLKDLLGDRRRPVVIVANKCDLDDKKRVISREVADTIVTIDWESRFVEVSAKNNINIARIFKEILLQVRFPYELNPSTHRRRTSLPVFKWQQQNNNNNVIMSKNSKNGRKGKRNSCAVS